MFSNFLKNLSILKKFLFINFIFFTIIGLFTFLYLKNVKPNLIKKKSSNHIEVINNTVDNLTRLKVKFVEKDIRKFLFSIYQFTVSFKPFSNFIFGFHFNLLKIFLSGVFDLKYLNQLKKIDKNIIK